MPRILPLAGLPLIAGEPPSRATPVRTVARRGLPPGRGHLALLLALLLFLPGCSRIVTVKDPLTAKEHVDLGYAYEKKGKAEKAEKEYRAAAKLDGKLYEARYNLGNILLARGENGEARKEYLAALEARPGAPEAANNLAWAAIRSGEEMEEAREALSAVLALPANRTPAVLDTYGYLLYRQGRVKEGTKVLREAETRCMADMQACPEETLRAIWAHLAEVPPREGKGAPVLPVGSAGGGPVR